MRDTWSEVASGIYRITGRSTQRKSDSPYQRGNQICSETRHEASASDSFGINSTHNEDQNKCADDFANYIGSEIADGRHCGKTEQLEIFVLCLLPVRQKVQPHQRRSCKSAGHLRNYVRDKLGKVSRLNAKPKGNCRIQVGIGTAASHGYINPSHHGETP